jgi:uncharacterized membrane protein
MVTICNDRTWESTRARGAKDAEAPSRSGMNWLKFLHILGATVWIGGGATLIVVGMRARRSSDPSTVAEFARVVPYVGMRLLGPAWIVLLITGVWMVLVSSAWKFSQPWVLLALGLFALAFLIGAVQLSRVGIQLERTVRSGQGPDVAALVGRWILAYGLVVAVLLVSRNRN